MPTQPDPNQDGNNPMTQLPMPSKAPMQTPNHQPFPFSLYFHFNSIHLNPNHLPCSPTPLSLSIQPLFASGLLGETGLKTGLAALSVSVRDTGSGLDVPCREMGSGDNVPCLDTGLNGSPEWP